MKKTKIWGFPSVFAAAALLLGVTSCDTGNEEYLPETPTTYYSYSETGNDETVKATWDFQNTLVYDLNGSDAVITKMASLLNDDGTLKAEAGSSGATLTPSDDIKGHSKDAFYDSNSTVAFAVAGDNSSSLKKLTKFYFTLTLKGQSNIYIDAAGGGGATSARYIAIEDEGETLVAYKDNLASKKTVLFQVQGAPAGTYKIYVAGSVIKTIEVKTGTVTKPVEITKLVLYQDGKEASNSPASFEVYETATFVANNVTADATEDVTAEAIWTSSDESVATVKAGVVTGVAPGTALIRARIGRFYDERTVTVTASTKTRYTLFSKANAPSAATKVGDFSADEVKKLIEAVCVGEDIATISDVTLTMTDDVDTASDKSKTLDGWSTEPSSISGDASDWKKCALYWQDSGPDSALTADLTVATLKFKVAPKSGSVKIAKITAEGNNGRNYTIKGTIGSAEKSQDVKKAYSLDLDFSSVDAISTATEVTIEFIIPNGKKAKSGFGIQNLTVVVQK